jgi:hypothetical protein
MSVLPPLAIAQASDRTELRRATVLRHEGFFVVRDRDDVLHLVHRGGEVELPIAALGFVEQLAAHPRFRADEVLRWDRALSWDAARELLAALVDAGVLVDRA